MGKPLLVTLMLTTLLTPFGGKAHRKTVEGNRQFAAGELEEALAAYTEAQVSAPEAPELHYDIGNVLYRQGDYEGAAEAFKRALLSAEADLEPLAAYNLGNARYRQGDFRQAVESYRRALEVDPDDADAKRNLELALRALERQPQQPQGGEQQQQPKEEQEQQEQQQDSQADREPRDEEQTAAGSSEEQEQQGQPGDESEEQPQPQSGQAKSMTPEQAERLLDGLTEQEQKILREEAQRRTRAGPAREKDW